MSKFLGKRALVTGAGAGIGRALAIRLSELGAKVFALNNVSKDLDSLKANHPFINPVCVDLREWEATREAVKELTPFHLLVNNAGVVIHNSFLSTTHAGFDHLFDVNVKAVMNVSQVVAEDLIEREEKGAIVHISSASGQRATKNLSLYSSTKGAINSLTRAMAQELAPKGIRVNAVAPGVVKTEMGKPFWSDPRRANFLLSVIPQRKIVEVNDVVNAVVYLLSDDSDMVNGHILPVDGGFLAV